MELLAHAGGIDELAIFLFPVFFGAGLWLMTRRKRAAGDDEEPRLASAIGAGEESAPKPAEGATRLHLLMNGSSSGDTRPAAAPAPNGGGQSQAS